MRTFVRVSLDQIASNYLRIQQAVEPRAEVIAVVKADAYGHGAIQAARVLAAHGCRRFAVAGLDEGAALREARLTGEILALSGLVAGEEAEAARLEITPMVHSQTMVDRWAQQALQLERRLPCCLKVDTGMNRLGLPPDADRILALVDANPQLEFRAVATHLASAEDFQSPDDDEQQARFDELLDALAAGGWSPPEIHSHNSAGTAYRNLGRSNLVRTGLALYGYVDARQGPGPDARFSVEPALEWRAHILAIRELAAGARVGYGGSYTAPRATRAAVLAVGYGDGYPRALSNRGHVLLRGVARPIIGRISMDITVVDISSQPDAEPPTPDDEATLLGPGLDAQQLAAECDTIAYELLCGISQRVPRVYDDSQPGPEE